MKILITGSHFTPAEATIDELQKQSNVEIVYVGRKFTLEGDKSLSVESQVLPKMGIKFIPLITGRLQRSFTIHTIPSLLKIPIGILQSFFIVLKEHPDVVLSFGGYVAVPVIISSWLFSIPMILHEQTLVSGLANSISANFVNKIAISFKENEEFNNKKTVLTGNPMRKEILTDQKLMDIDLGEIVHLAKNEKLPLILITGGNQGSHVINELIRKIMHDLTKIACVIHQTGDSHFNDFKKLAEEKNNLKNPKRYLPMKWINGNDIGSILRKVDLIVSRAGMNTLLEVAFIGIPTLVIPLPYLNEQNINAKFFEKLGLVRILDQNELNEKKLFENISTMLKNLETLKEDAKNAKKVIIVDAAKRLALETLLLGIK